MFDGLDLFHSIIFGQVASRDLIKLDGQNNALLSSASMIRKDRHSLGDDRLQVRVVWYKFIRF